MPYFFIYPLIRIYIILLASTGSLISNPLLLLPHSTEKREELLNV